MKNCSIDKTRKAIFILMTTAVIVLMMAGTLIAEGALINSRGTLSAVEDDGLIIIDDKGYSLHSSVRILNAFKKHTTIDKLILPIGIYYEFVYTEIGPVIKLIQVLPQ